MDQRIVEGASEASTGLGGSTLAAIGRCVETRSRRWLVAITLLLGLAPAAALSAGLPPADRTYAMLSGPVQLLMSVAVPFIGVLLAHDLLRTPPARLAPTLLAASSVAAAVGAFGAGVCALAVAVSSPGAAADPWNHVAIIAAGSVLVQVVAQLVGVGLGLLIRGTVVACLSTIVLPLGIWLVLGSVDVLRPAQAFTPYAAAQNLLSGEMSAPAWTQWLVVLLLWGAGLNALGTARLKRRHQDPHS
ncbi:MAG: hypothetical protein ACRDXX_00115 [Stackebrandtia sp.]